MTRTPKPSGLDLVTRPPRVEASWWRRWRYEGRTEFREILFTRYAPLAKSLASLHFRRRTMIRVDRDDFNHLAYEGLLQALDRFDPLRGVPFDAFARRRIAGSIADGTANMTEVSAQIRQRHRTEQDRRRSLQRSGSSADAVGELSHLVGTLALGLLLEGTNVIEPADGADTRQSAYESVELRQLVALVRREVERLPTREGQVIRNHYELGLTFAQIAGLLDLSRGRVSQLHHAGLARLRKQIGTFD